MGFTVFFKKKKKKSITSTEGSLLYSSSEIQIWQPSTYKYVVLKSSGVSILNGYRVLNKEKNCLVKDTTDRYIWNNNKDNHQFQLLPTATQNVFLKLQYIPLLDIYLNKDKFCPGVKKKLTIFLIQSYPQTNSHWQYTA